MEKSEKRRNGQLRGSERKNRMLLRQEGEVTENKEEDSVQMMCWTRQITMRSCAEDLPYTARR